MSRLHEQRTFKLPDILSMSRSLIPSSVNPHYAKVSAESVAWITGPQGLYSAADTAVNARWEEYFAKTDGPLLAAYVYPYASYEKFRQCCDLVNMLYAMDEISDYQTGEDARETMEHHVRVLSGGPSDGSPVSNVSVSFREKVKDHFRPQAYKRFLKVYKDYAYAVITEAELRDNKQVPPVEEYRIFRRENGAVKPCFAIIEACFDLDLPNDVFEHPLFQRIYNAALDLILWSNDLYSYKMERARDGPTCSNVISSLIYHNKCTLQEAADFIGVEFQSILAQMISDKAAMPSFGSIETDRQVEAYIFGLEQWIVGNLRFCFASHRYLGQEREEIEKSLIVKLLPSSDTESDKSD